MAPRKALIRTRRANWPRFARRPRRTGRGPGAALASRPRDGDVIPDARDSVTNEMGQRDADFEKGVADGAEATLRLVTAVARWWREGRPERP